VSKNVASLELPDGTGVRQRTKEQRPGQILEAAFAEFAEKGYAAARLEDVARRIGVTKGTIYVYFPSKQELFQQVCRSFLLPVFDEMERLPEEFHGTAADLLRAILAIGYRDLVATPRSREFLRLMIGEASREPELVAFYSRELIHRGNGALRAVLARGVATGEFRPDAARLLDAFPEILVAPTVLATLNRLMLGDPGDVDTTDQMEAHLALLLDGLRARP